MRLRLDSGVLTKKILLFCGSHGSVGIGTADHTETRRVYPETLLQLETGLQCFAGILVMIDYLLVRSAFNLVQNHRISNGFLPGLSVGLEGADYLNLINYLFPNEGSLTLSITQVLAECPHPGERVPPGTRVGCRFTYPPL